MNLSMLKNLIFCSKNMKHINMKEFNIIYRIIKKKMPDEPIDFKEFNIIYQVMKKNEPLN